MVHDDIDHKQHPTSMDLVTELLEILRRPKSVVQFPNVSDPIAMIGISICRARSVIILVHGADPNGSEAHGLNVVQVGDDSIPCATTKRLLRDITGCRLIKGCGETKAVCDDPWVVELGSRKCQIRRAH